MIFKQFVLLKAMSTALKSTNKVKATALLLLLFSCSPAVDDNSKGIIEEIEKSMSVQKEILNPTTKLESNGETVYQVSSYSLDGNYRHNVFIKNGKIDKELFSYNNKDAFNQKLSLYKNETGSASDEKYPVIRNSEKRYRVNYNEGTSTIRIYYNKY